MTARQVPLSRVRYEQIDIDLTGVDTRETLDALVTERVREELEGRCRDCRGLSLCACRLRLTGATHLHRQLPAYARELTEQWERQLGEFATCVDDVILDTAPAVDLQQLARGGDVPADLARVLLRLAAPGAGDEEVSRLIEQVTELNAGVCAAQAYHQLPASRYPVPDAAAARDALCREGMRLLDALLAQKESR